MAKKLTTVTKIVINQKGLDELLKSDEVSEYTMGLAADIARDAHAGDPDREYTTLLRKNRKSRNVATVLDAADDSMDHEADTGNLSRAARKER